MWERNSSGDVMSAHTVSIGFADGGDMAVTEGNDEFLTLPQDVVIGEAVALDLRPASFATRALALLLDILIVITLLLVMLFLVAGATESWDEAATQALALTTTVTVMVLLPAGWETLTRGRSPGKLAAGLRVVRDDGGPIRWRQALTRALLAVLEIYLLFGSLALITSLWNPRGKRVGDLLAGTYVIRVRVPQESHQLPQPSPQLAAWSAGADLARLPDPLAVASRRFLMRAERMNPGSRIAMGQDLATQVSRYVAPSPPGQVNPEAFLNAVLAERHRRSLISLQADQHRRAQRASRHRSAPVLSPGSDRLINES